MKKKIALISMSLVLLLALSACSGSTDVVGDQSTEAFKNVLAAIPEKVSEDKMNKGWAITSPDGGERFIWSKDYSESEPHDVMLEFDLKPFVDAGLDINKFPEGLIFGDKIMIGKSLGDEKVSYDGDVTALSSYLKIVELQRDQIKYHAALDHFGIDVGDGNMFEWAKDMSTNDKDIVFVVDPQIFINAGVRPTEVDGWVFAKVTVDDADGNPIEVDKFLKPFDL